MFTHTATCAFKIKFKKKTDSVVSFTTDSPICLRKKTTNKYRKMIYFIYLKKKIPVLHMNKYCT